MALLRNTAYRMCWWKGAVFFNWVDRECLMKTFCKELKEVRSRTQVERPEVKLIWMLENSRRQRGWIKWMQVERGGRGPRVVMGVGSRFHRGCWPGEGLEFLF